MDGRRADPIRADPPPAPGGREHPHHAGGGGREREPGDAVLHRQGQLGDAAPGPEGVLPVEPPFPLLHVDTTWKFQEMYDSGTDGRRARDWSSSFTRTRMPRAGHQPVQPWFGAAHRHVEDRRSKQASRPHGFDVAFGGARRDEEKIAEPRSGCSPSAPPSIAGIRRASGPSCGGCTTPASARASRSGSSRCRTGPSSTSGSTSTWSRSRSCRSTSRPSARWSSATGR